MFSCVQSSLSQRRRGKRRRRRRNMKRRNIESIQIVSEDLPIFSYNSCSFFLIGNEYPHDIIMINIQKNFSSRDLRHFTSFPSLPGLIMKYLNSDAQGQFILRPRNSARSQQQKSESAVFFRVAFLSSHFNLSINITPYYHFLAWERGTVINNNNNKKKTKKYVPGP